MAARSWIDGVEVSDVVIEGSSTRRLNRPSEAQIKIPMTLAPGGAGSLLKLELDGWLHFHGRVLLCETEADEDMGYTVYNATDPLEMWKWRPVRDPGEAGTLSEGDPGDFSDPSIIEDYVYGPDIISAMIDGSEGTDGPGVGVGAPVLDAEGVLFLAKGTFATGTVSMIGAPVDWPMTMADLASLLISTGEVDVVITPIEIDGSGNYGQIDVYNGDYGSDLTTSVAFQYGLGLYNVRHLRWNEDMTNMANKIWYYLGPRLDQQHWRASINGSDPLNPAWSSCGFTFDPTDIVMAGQTSASTYGVRMDIPRYDSRGDEATLGYCLFRQLWAIESWLRATPRNLVHIVPIRGSGGQFGDFDIGDIVLVEAHADVRGGFSGAQRVYEYTVSWGEDSVLELSELQTSADQESFA